MLRAFKITYLAYLMKINLNKSKNWENIKYLNFRLITFILNLKIVYSVSHCKYQYNSCISANAHVYFWSESDNFYHVKIRLYR